MNIAMLMDDIHSIKTYKDTSFALLLAAQARGHALYYFRQKDWKVVDGQAYALLCRIEVEDRENDYVRILQREVRALAEMDIVFQRKDPPFNMNYIYDTYLLDLLEESGVTVVNPPAALRHVNEKFFITRFPQCTPPTLITRQKADILAFLDEYPTAVAKPLDGMGGMGIFKLRREDDNLSAILDATALKNEMPLMIQAFIPQISAGDKRIILIDGKPVDHALLRMPKKGEFRANLAAGGHGVVQALQERDYWLCEQLAPWISQMRLLLVGLDVIGGYITEINVTSPTCIREIMAETGEDISGAIIEAATQRHLAHKTQ